MLPLAQAFNAANPSSIADPQVQVDRASAVPALRARLPEALVPSILLARARADSRPAVLQAPVVAPVSVHVPALAHGLVLASVPVPAALLRLLTPSVRSARLRAVAAVASSSIPRLKKAR